MQAAAKMTVQQWCAGRPRVDLPSPYRSFDPAPEPRRGGGAGEMGRTRLNPSVTLSWMTGLLKQETSS
ncbi:hypothetical protein QC762_0010810 [Podospora pseudocomata]|uniref:Uncharacterized protein n=1 Tax=Podospora pseudocomata TaxID=2093779 RepID=A0ABR0GVE1_9PEZI|nr:hypothetical protein QC762_0010810 [Podospora pseudocomata]